jgi:CP family cyanate transporter-like MFS transporter
VSASDDTDPQRPHGSGAAPGTGGARTGNGSREESAGGSRVLLAVAILLVAANLRATFTGVGPLLEQIGADLDAAPATLGLLASVPLLGFALVSPLAHGLAIRFGLFRAVLWALLVLTLGTLWRSLPGMEANVWIGTALIGAGAAIGNVLLPAVVKRDFADRSAGMTAVFTATMGGVGAIFAGLVVPISHLAVGGSPLGWRWALAATGILLPFAIVAWALAARRASRPANASAAPVATIARGAIWRDGLAWWITAFMGLQSMTFYMLNTWLAPYLQAQGMSDVAAGAHVMILQLTGVAGSLAVPGLLRLRGRRWIAVVIPLVYAVSVLVLLLAPGLETAAVVVAGASGGALLSMALILFSIRSRDHAAASALSGMAQSVGYLVAATGPILFGALLDLTGAWTLPFLVVVLTLVALAVVGSVVGRDRFVVDR